MLEQVLLKFTTKRPKTSLPCIKKTKKNVNNTVSTKLKDLKTKYNDCVEDDKREKKKVLKKKLDRLKLD